MQFESGGLGEERPSTAPQPTGIGTRTGGADEGHWGSSVYSGGIRHILPATSRIVSRPRAGRISNTDSGASHGDGGSQSHCQRRTQTARSGSTTLMGWTSQVDVSRQPEPVAHGGVVQGVRQMASARRPGAVKKAGSHAAPRPATSHGWAPSSPAGAAAISREFKSAADLVQKSPSKSVPDAQKAPSKAKDSKKQGAQPPVTRSSGTAPLSQMPSLLYHCLHNHHHHHHCSIIAFVTTTTTTTTIIALSLPS